MTPILITLSLLTVCFHLKNWGLRTPILLMILVVTIRGILLPITYGDLFSQEVINQYISFNSLYIIANIALFGFLISSSKERINILNLNELKKIKILIYYIFIFTIILTFFNLSNLINSGLSLKDFIWFSRSGECSAIICKFKDIMGFILSLLISGSYLIFIDKRIKLKLFDKFIISITFLLILITSISIGERSAIVYAMFISLVQGCKAVKNNFKIRRITISIITATILFFSATTIVRYQIFSFESFTKSRTLLTRITNSNNVRYSLEVIAENVRGPKDQNFYINNFYSIVPSIIWPEKPPVSTHVLFSNQHYGDFTNRGRPISIISTYIFFSLSTIEIFALLIFQIFALQIFSKRLFFSRTFSASFTYAYFLQVICLGISSTLLHRILIAILFLLSYEILFNKFLSKLNFSK